MQSKSGGVTRRRFLVILGDVALGTFFLPPLTRMKTASRAGRAKALTRCLQAPPTKTNLGGGRFSLMWIELPKSGDAKVMYWNPETPQELEDARTFYEATRRVGEIPEEGVVEKLVGKVGKLVGAMGRSEKEKRLLDAIRADMDSDEPRLAYARYLSERGDPLGDFIEVDCLLENMTKKDPRYAALNVRWGDLLERHGKDFVKPLMKLGLSPEIFGNFMPELWFTRGFVEEITIDKPGILPEKADRLFDAAPIVHRLIFDYDRLDVKGIANVREMAQVTSLELGEVEMDLEKLGALMRSPHLRKLKEFKIASMALFADGAHLLANSPVMASVTSLALCDCPLGREGAKVLVSGKTLRNLEILELEFGNHDQAVAAELAASPNLSRLRRLSLDHNNLGEGGVAALLRSRSMTNIEELKLWLGPEIKVFASLPWPEKLHALDLGLWPQGPETLEAIKLLAGCKQALKLTSLELSLAGVDTEGACTLARSPNLRNLAVLELESCRLGDAGVKAIAESRYLTQLTELDVRLCEMGVAGARALANSPNFSHLKLLSVSQSEVQAEGAAILRERFDEEVLYGLDD